MTTTHAETPATETDPAVEIFREFVLREMEDYDGPTATDHIAERFAEALARHRAQVTGLQGDVRETAAQAQVSRALLAHASRAVGRESDAGGVIAARLDRAERVIEQVEILRQQLARDGEGEIADRLAVHLEYPDISVGSDPANVIAFVPDTRWTVGWLTSIPGQDARPYPFAGWVLTSSRRDGASRVPETAYLISGAMWPLSELERRGWILNRLD